MDHSSAHINPPSTAPAKLEFDEIRESSPKSVTAVLATESFFPGEIQHKMKTTIETEIVPRRNLDEAFSHHDNNTNNAVPAVGTTTTNVEEKKTDHPHDTASATTPPLANPKPSDVDEEIRQLQQELEELRQMKQLEARREEIRKQKEQLLAEQLEVERLERETEQRRSRLQQSIGSLATLDHPSPSLLPKDDHYSPSTDYDSYTPKSSPNGLRQKGLGILKRRAAPQIPYEDDGSTSDIESQRYTKKDKSIVDEPKRSKGRTLGGPTPQQRDWKLLAKKIATAILTDIDDETLQREDTETVLVIITLIKEAMLGILIAFAAVSFVLFLDHRFLLNLPTARNFRKATFQLMNDKETLTNLEESANIKFIPMEEYQDNLHEIDMAVNKTELADAIFNTRSEDLTNMTKELEEVSSGYDEMYEELELDMFCEQCVWSKAQRIMCGQRVRALEERYNTPKFKAMLSAMQKPSCRKNEAILAVEREQRKEVQQLLKDWETKKDEFCGECDWEANSNMSCSQRAEYLNYRYNTPINAAKARVMVEGEQCLMSTRRAEDELLDRFCRDCHWGNKMTCGQRVDYLMYTYKNSERVATKSAMDRPSCVTPADEEIEEYKKPQEDDLGALR